MINNNNKKRHTEHLFTCPALIPEQNSLREQVDSIFKKWAIPYAALGQLPERNMKSQWMNILQKKHSNNKRPLKLSDEKAQRLIEDYWEANRTNRHKAFPHFWKSINRAL